MVAIEILEIQVRVELEDPGVNTRVLLMLGRAEEKHPILNNRSIPSSGITLHRLYF